jgi:AcrR family transcriptional regulator
MTTTSGPDVRSDDAVRIIGAAWRVLGRSGFRSLKVRQVIIEAHTSAFVFYRHFPSKSHLLLGLMREEMRRAARDLSAAMDAADDARDKIRAFVEHSLTIAYDDTLAARARMFMDSEVARELPADVEQAYELVLAPLVAVLELGNRQGVFDCHDPRSDARSLQHLCSGAVSDRLAGRMTAPKETAIEHVAEFALRALRG